MERCRVVLQAAAGTQDIAIASAFGIMRAKAARWRQRYLLLGAMGPERDAARPGRTPAISAARKAGVVRRKILEMPANATHWSMRGMAAANVGPARATAHWRGARPEAASGEAFKLSREHFSRDLTQNRLRRGALPGIADLVEAIYDYLDRHNQSPRPFIWTARATDILAKVQRARRALDKPQSA